MTSGVENIHADRLSDPSRYLKKYGAPHTNNVQLGRYGRDRENVWRVPGLNKFSKDRRVLFSSNPSSQPV